eukprot:scaffold290609_cov23-Tisochrysis_lutea.AAC.1
MMMCTVHALRFGKETRKVLAVRAAPVVIKNTARSLELSKIDKRLTRNAQIARDPSALGKGNKKRLLCCAAYEGSFAEAIKMPATKPGLVPSALSAHT